MFLLPWKVYEKNDLSLVPWQSNFYLLKALKKVRCLLDSGILWHRAQKKAWGKNSICLLFSVWAVNRASYVKKCKYVELLYNLHAYSSIRTPKIRKLFKHICNKNFGQINLDLWPREKATILQRIRPHMATQDHTRLCTEQGKAT